MLQKLPLLAMMTCRYFLSTCLSHGSRDYIIFVIHNTPHTVHCQ